jgi:hypothetical protein
LATSAEDRLRVALAIAVGAAQELGEGTVTSITVDLQESGERPYRVHILEEVVPYAGLTSLDRGRDLGATSPGRSDEPQPEVVSE